MVILAGMPPRADGFLGVFEGEEQGRVYHGCFVRRGDVCPRSDLMAGNPFLADHRGTCHQYRFRRPRCAPMAQKEHPAHIHPRSDL